MPFNLGATELLIIFGIVLLVFGAKRLPEIGQSMGKGIREFKRSLSDMQKHVDEGDDAAPPRQIDTPEGERSGDPKKLSE
jgi:sec-independent protein translocase protein TatA